MRQLKHLRAGSWQIYSAYAITSFVYTY